jgi:hypothetical protein
MLKDIVQPKKSRVEMDTKRFASTFTQSPMFLDTLKGYSHALNLKILVTAFRALKWWSLF